MRKITYALSLTMLLVSCGGGSSASTVDLWSLNDEGKVAAVGKLSFRFFENPEVPFISIEDAFALSSSLRADFLEDESAHYSVSQADKVVTVKDESGDTATFDLNKQTITFSDFDAFFQGAKQGHYPNSLATPTSKTRSYRIVESESTYKKGSPVSIDFNPYPSLSIKEADGKAYLPFCVYNDLMQGLPGGMLTFAYNFKDAFLAPAGMRDLSKEKLTDLSEKYYKEAPKMASVSKSFARFAYDQTMFGLDYFYGLKGIRGIASFSSFAKEKGLEEGMLSGDFEKMQEAYGTLLLKCLEDGHTSPLTASPLTDYSSYGVEDSWRSPKAIQKEKESEAFTQARKTKKADKPFEVVGDTAFLYFDDFMSLDEKTLYGNLTEEVIQQDNAALFAYAYQKIQADPNIKNVVVDLATNNGGDAEGLVYCLGTLLGKFYVDSGNALSKSHTRLTYQTDINVDGKIDEKDIPLCRDHKIYMLDSKFAFSCGNLFPIAARYNSDKVRCIGDRTGGGTCSVKYSTTALGDTFVSSSLTTLLKDTNGSYLPIEDGAEVDIPLSYEKMFDRKDIVALLK